MSQRTARSIQLLRTRTQDGMRASMSRQLMRFGRVHVVVVASSPALREALVTWLRGAKRVRMVRAATSARDLGGDRLECDLVVASGVDGPAELRAIARKVGTQAGLVALTLGVSPMPAGWVGVRPGVSRTHVLDQAVAHPERGLMASATTLGGLLIANVAAFAAFLYVPQAGASFERAALAYAERFPDNSTWWHVWGSGGPLLASPSWPLIKAAAATGIGPGAFVLLAALVGAILGIALLAVLRRTTGLRIALVAAVLAVATPALWVWPRGGDVGSLAGLAGVALAISTTATRRLRFPSVALAVVVSAFGGYVWVAVTCLAAVISAVWMKGHRRATAAAAFFGLVMSTAIAVPPILVRGLDGLRPSLARAPAASDIAPVIGAAAIVAICVALGRGRRWRPVLAAAVVLLVAANALALVVPVSTPAAPGIPTTGAFGRLAVHPAQALSIVTSNPELPTTGADIPAGVMLGEGERVATGAQLDRLGVDRLMAPDRTSAIIFNERDWVLADRERLLFTAPFVRPVLTAGITPTILVIAEEADARNFGAALSAIGAASENVIPVWWPQPLDELTVPQLREFTIVAVYGRPWSSLADATDLLQTYLDQSGFLFMDLAGRPGSQPLGLPEAEVQQRDPDEYRVEETVPENGNPLITGETGWSGRVVALAERFDLGGDDAWERAAMLVGGSRVIQFGVRGAAADVLSGAHMVWSGVDLPGKAAAGDEAARLQLERAIEWMIADAGAGRTGNYGRPEGLPCDGDKPGTCATQLENDTAVSTFRSPTEWRLEMKAATTAALFKEAFHPQWRASLVQEMGDGVESTTNLTIHPTVDGHMYVTLPPNARIVEFVFERHPLETASRGASAVAAFLTLAISFFLWRRR